MSPTTCKVCQTPLSAGTRAFWGPSQRTATCTSLTCAKADGLTREEWRGSPVSGRWVPVVSATRLGPGYQRADQ